MKGETRGNDLSLFHYPGNIHIHSSYSDGNATIGQIAEAAAREGLRYVIITDHETMAGLPEESIRGGVVVLVGLETNRLHSHCLALGIDRPVESDEEDPQKVIDRVREAGGLAFIAHPFEKSSSFIEGGKAYPWVHWPVFGFHGIEIWNYTSSWRGRHPSRLRNLSWYFFNRRGAMNKAPQDELRLWDCYNRSGHRMVGIGGSDAHAFVVRVGPFKAEVFAYRYLFKAINTYIVLGEELSSELSCARKQIICALRNGRCYIVYEELARGGTFDYRAIQGDQSFLMGSVLDYEPTLVLRINAPLKRSLIRLIRDGRLEKECVGSELEHRPGGPGVYRVEVYYRPRLGRPRPWIYSNPIYLE